MARVVISLRIMPESPETDLAEVEAEAKKKIVDFAGETEFKVEIAPIAFGLKSLTIMFIMDEKKGATDPLEAAIAQLDGVNSVEVTDVRRTIG